MAVFEMFGCTYSLTHSYLVNTLSVVFRLMFSDFSCSRSEQNECTLNYVLIKIFFKKIIKQLGFTLSLPTFQVAAYNDYRL